MLEYKELNERLEKYCKENEKTFYIMNLHSILLILFEAKNILINPCERLETNIIRLAYDEKVDGLTSISLVREFLNTLGSNYTDLFDESFRNGSFGYEDVINDKSDMPLYKAGLLKNNKYYNVGFKGNILDGYSLVHEFFHYLNISKSNFADLFSELISIYMENKYLDFLETKGHSKTDILKTRLQRYISFFYGQQDLLHETLILNIKEKLGAIKEQDYDFLISYKDVFSKDIKVDVYYKNLNVALNRLRNIDNENVNSKNKFSPSFTFRYFFGVLLSSFLLQKNDVVITSCILDLNNKLALACDDDVSFNEGFNVLGINIEDNTIIKKSIESVNVYYDEALDKTLILKAKQKR